MSKAGVLAEDKLFATLDPKTSNIFIQDEKTFKGVQILLTDTVGFINKLPHEFIYAFESTLSEARHADMLLHVVDASNPEFNLQIEVVNNVLKKIKADSIPQVLVFNKIDKLQSLSGLPDGIKISASKNLGLDELRKTLI